MHLEALNNKTKTAWGKCNFLDGFYLAGGTALALQIGHRISVDLDFFSTEPIKKTLLAKIEKVFGTVNVLVNDKNELTVSVDEVKITCLHYPFPLLYPNVPTYIRPLANIKDIASIKAYTLGRRRSLKDYVDLYFIFSNNLCSLNETIADSRQKYGSAFNDRLFLEQLLSPEDLEEEQINWLVEKPNIEQIKEYFTDLIKQTNLI
jgi:hypothetical protein